jgi:integrase/recombinase XerD
MAGREPLPGGAPLRLLRADTRLLRADEQVWSEMLEGWRASLLARNSAVSTIRNYVRVLTDFQTVCTDYPWRWSPADVGDYVTVLHARAHERRATQAAKSTVRGYLMVIRSFCSFLCEPRYGWAELCHRLFGEYPAQVCFEYNLPVHVSDNEAEHKRRAFSRDEVQRLFDYFDNRVDDLYAANKKAWLTTLRDAYIAEVAYAYGVRRQELLWLQIHDFGPNPHVPQYGSFGAMYVRWGKGSRGSQAKRRTVLTVPLMGWAPEILEAWVTDPDCRQRMTFGAASQWLWPSERGAQLSLDSYATRFTDHRRAAGLPDGLSLHGFRRSYVTHLIEAGYDPLFVQQQVGHEQSSTTALYTQVSSDYRQKTLQRMLNQRLESADVSYGKTP